MPEPSSVNAPLKPKISLITAVYNNEAFIGTALASAQAQDYPNIEHIIIDGGSTDRTLEILESNRDKIAKIISEPDEGIYDASTRASKRPAGSISHSYILMIFSNTPLRSQT